MNEVKRIYYFSGTGNSLSIARDLQSSLGNIELLSIATLMRSPGRIAIEGEIIGFVFPVYFGRVPVVVEEFLERVDFGETDYLFAVTNGGGAFCRTHKILDNQLRGKGRSLAAGFTIRMPGVHPKVHKFIRKKDEEFFRDKQQRLEEVSQLIRRKEAHRLETNFGLFGILLSHVLFKSLYKMSKNHSLDSALWTNDSCRQCGTCRSVCPVQNIELEATGPRWLGKCLNCARCYHLCPHEAIEFGDDTMKRYRNPEIDREELLA